MSTQFNEFIAPFPQVETIKMDGTMHEFPGVSFPDPEVIFLSGGYKAIQFDFPDNACNDNKFNIVDGFELFRNTRRYIQTKHDEYFGDDLSGKARTDRLHSLIIHTGLNNSKNPEETIDQWRNLKGMIHKKYFDVIGVDPSVLSMVLESDAEEYMDILNSSIIINCFVVRYMSCMYEGKVIPKLNEWLAINYIRAFQQKMPVRCCINIRDVKSIFVELDNTVIYSYCYPEFRIEGDYYRFSGDNRDNAVVHVTEIDLESLDLE